VQASATFLNLHIAGFGRAVCSAIAPIGPLGVSPALAEVSRHRDDAESLTSQIFEQRMIGLICSGPFQMRVVFLAGPALAF
jgi:hypothetical protein